MFQDLKSFLQRYMSIFISTWSDKIELSAINQDHFSYFTFLYFKCCLLVLCKGYIWLNRVKYRFRFKNHWKDIYDFHLLIIFFREIGPVTTVSAFSHFFQCSFHWVLLFGGFITDLLVDSKVSEGNKKWGDIIFVSMQTGMLEARFT